MDNLEVSFDYHGEVGVVILGNVFLIFTQLNRDDASQMWTRIIPKDDNQNNWLCIYAYCQRQRL